MVLTRSNNKIIPFFQGNFLLAETVIFSNNACNKELIKHYIAF